MSTTSFLLRKARFFQKKLANCASVKETMSSITSISNNIHALCLNARVFC